MESLQNGVATHFQVTPLISMRPEPLASSQSCHSVDANAQCKRDLEYNYVSGYLSHYIYLYTIPLDPSMETKKLSLCITIYHVAFIMYLVLS